MTTYESVSADIKQIFDCFEQYLDVYRDDSWPDNPSIETIKNCFKLGTFVEETIEKFGAKKCLPTFMNALNCYLKSKKYTKTFESNIFSTACDSLLMKFFTNKNLDLNTLDVAVRVYTTLFPKERFETVLNNLLLQSASFDALKNYTLECKVVDLKELECRLLINAWSNDLQYGRGDDINTAITNMLCIYNVDKLLPLLIKMLSLTNISPEECLVKDMVLKLLLENMKDRSILSKTFWIALFKSVKCSELCSACLQFNEFFVELLNFVIYIGSMMIADENLKWTPDVNISICPEITYEELIALIKKLCEISDGNKKYITQRIKTARSSVGSELWDDIERLL